MHLEQLRKYASVPDDTQDQLLNELLRSAMLSVQEHSDVALLPCTFELTVTDVLAYCPIRLYQGASEVLSVTSYDGTPLQYKQGDGCVILPYSATCVTITYKNAVNIVEAQKLMPAVWQLATAIYDGEDPKMQASILKTTYGR